MRIHVTNDPTFPYMITDSDHVGGHWQGVSNSFGVIRMYAHNYHWDGDIFLKWQWRRK